MPCRTVRTAKKLANENPATCYMPTLSFWIERKDSRLCESADEYLNATVAVGRALNRVLLSGACPKSCEMGHFSFSRRQRKMLPESYHSNASRLNVYFKEPSWGVEHSREQRLYDFNTILAAVGGSMGMFLGFSFLQFSLWVVEILGKCKWRPIKRSNNCKEKVKGQK